MNEKNILVHKSGKTRRARESELTWFKHHGWLPTSDSAPSATNAPTHQRTSASAPSVSAPQSQISNNKSKGN